MDKRIGKILLACLLGSTLVCADQSIKLYLQDMDQNPIRQAEIAVPFLLQVVAENIENADYPDSIDGFDQFQVTRYGASQSTSIINGQKSERKIFNYVLKSDKPGSYKIGPVSIKDSQGLKIKSDVLHFRVGDTAVAYNLKKQSYFLQVQVDKKSVFVGQDLLLSIRFYHNQDFDQLKIIEPRFDNLHADSTLQGPQEGQEFIRGQEYNYKEWKMKVYPQKSGNIVVPAIQAVYTVPSYLQRNSMGGLFDMFSLNAEKTVYSSPRSVQVKDLPESDMYKGVTAIGTFSEIVFNIEQEKVDVGEGVVAKLEVKGDGNLDMITAPKLNLPTGLRYYESNSTVLKQSKVFEYILQADQQGDYTIEPQSFAYFDIEKEEYRSLSSKAQSITVVAEAPAVINSQQTITKDTVAKDTLAVQKKYVFKEHEIDFVNETGLFIQESQESMVQYILSWIVFFLLWCSLVIAFYWFYIYIVGVPLMQTYWLSYVVIRLSAYRAYQQQDLHKMYMIIKSICDKYNVDVHNNDIVQLFVKVKSDQVAQDWSQFLERMMHVLFSGQTITSKEKQQLLQQTIGWIKLLLLVLRVRKSRQYLAE